MMGGMDEVPISVAAKEIGVAPSTLRRWERDGIIKPARSPGGQRRYDLDELRAVAYKQPRCRYNPTRSTICYARVSTPARKGNLDTQCQVLELFCAARGWTYETLTDIGSGLNYRRKNFMRLIQLVEEGKVERIVVNHRDRLVRFGFELVEQICKANDTGIVVVSESPAKGYEEELVEDVLSVITVFCAKLYGSRSRRNRRIVQANRELFANATDAEGEDAPQSREGDEPSCH